jgi:hypothetical protein
MVTPSDVLAKLIAEARGKLNESHYAPNPVELARAERKRQYLLQARRAAATHGRRVRPWEC